MCWSSLNATRLKSKCMKATGTSDSCAESEIRYNAHNSCVFHRVSHAHNSCVLPPSKPAVLSVNSVMPSMSIVEEDDSMAPAKGLIMIRMLTRTSLENVGAGVCRRRNVTKRHPPQIPWSKTCNPSRGSTAKVFHVLYLYGHNVYGGMKYTQYIEECRAFRVDCRGVSEFVHGLLSRGDTVCILWITKSANGEDYLCPAL